MTRREYRHEMVEDPVTGHHYWQTRKVELPSLDDERLMSLVSDIFERKDNTGRSPEGVLSGQSSVNSIYIWIGKYVSQSSSLSLQEPHEEEGYACKEQGRPDQRIEGSTETGSERS